MTDKPRSGGGDHAQAATRSKEYDAIFVGASLTSLAAAAALAAKGKAVLFWVGADIDPTPSSFRFAEGPLLYFGFEEGGVMEGFFSEIRYPIPNLKHERFLFKRTAPFLQVVQPNHRVDLYPQREETLGELKRDFAQKGKIDPFFEEIEKEAAVLYPFLGRFPQTEVQGFADRIGAWRQRAQFQAVVRNHQKKSAIEFLAPFNFDDQFLAFLNLQSLFAFQKPLADISAYDLILLESGFIRGGVRMIGGVSTLVSFFLKRITASGGRVVQDKEIARIEAGEKRSHEIFFADETHVLGKHLIVVEPQASSLLQFYFTIRREVIPTPMRESLLMTWGKEIPRDVIDFLLVRLNLSEEGDSQEKGSQDGLRALAVTVFFRPGIEVAEDRVEEVRAKVLERLGWLIPFSGSHLQEVGRKAEKGPFPASLKDQVVAWAKQRQALSDEIGGLYRPKGNKSVTLLSNDLSTALGWGTSFLAAITLARTVQEGR